VCSAAASRMLHLQVVVHLAHDKSKQTTDSSSLPSSGEADEPFQLRADGPRGVRPFVQGGPGNLPGPGQSKRNLQSVRPWSSLFGPRKLKMHRLGRPGGRGALPWALASLICDKATHVNHAFGPGPRTPEPSPRPARPLLFPCPVVGVLSPRRPGPPSSVTM
jgi:hypothetical protein